MMRKFLFLVLLALPLVIVAEESNEANDEVKVEEEENVLVLTKVGMQNSHMEALFQS